MNHAAVAVETALGEWALDISQTNPRVLTEYIRGPQGLAWTKAERKGFQWCGAFAGFCHGAAGLSYKIRHFEMPSTLRLYNEYRNTSRRIDPKLIEPGDIVVVSNNLQKAAGTHITLCVNREGGLIYTVEGNARGLRFSGLGNGVIKATRPLSRKDGGTGIDRTKVCPLTGMKVSHEVVHAYRFLATDYEQRD